MFKELLDISTGSLVFVLETSAVPCLLYVWLPLINIPDSQSVKWIQHHRSSPPSIRQIREDTQTHTNKNKGNWRANGEWK
jgi:hypothetical protein